MKIQEKMTTRGGNGSSSIKGLVAEHISKELADRLLSKTYLKQNTNITLYISNVGDDETADGSEQKPFKTFAKCIDYLHKNIVTNYTVLILFLTDYEDTDLTSISIRNLNYSDFLGVYANGHTVKIRPLKLYEGDFLFDRVWIKNNNSSTNEGNLYITENAQVLLRTSTLEDIEQTSKASIITNRGGKCYIQYGLTVITNKNNNPVFKSATNSIIVKEGSENITINGSGSSLIYCDNSSKFHMLGGSFTGSFTGKKYELYYNSLLNLRGRGTSVLVGTKDGTKDESSIIC